jgi:hypothetical protein
MASFTASAVTSGFLTVYSTTLDGGVQSLGQVKCSNPRSSGLFVAKLLQASDGNLWGVCGAYGTNNTYGEVFSVSTSGTLLTTVPFNDSHGAYPEVGVIQAKSGVVYGTTFDGGTDAKGVLAFGNVYPISGLPPIVLVTGGEKYYTYRARLLNTAEIYHWLRHPGMSRSR